MPWTGVLGWLASSSHSCFDCPIIMHDPLCHMTILQKSIIWTPYSYLIERTVNFWAGKDETAGNGFFLALWEYWWSMAKHGRLLQKTTQMISMVEVKRFMVTRLQELWRSLPLVDGGQHWHNNTYIWQWFRKWQCFKIALIYWRQANAWRQFWLIVMAGNGWEWWWATTEFNNGWE